MSSKRAKNVTYPPYFCLQGKFASPDLIIVAPSLPMTRSGKIMRRILRKIVAGEADQLGDISTLADPGIVAWIVERVG
jgi:acetyl-CoA synthetase